MSPQALIALLVLLLVLALSATPRAHDFTGRLMRQIRRRVPRRPRPRLSTGTTVITSSGEEVEVLEEAPPRPSLLTRYVGSPLRTVAAVVASVLVVSIVGLQLYRVLTLPPAGQFVVLVAPFLFRVERVRPWLVVGG